MDDRFRKLQELAIPLPTESTVSPGAGSASASPNAEATAGYYINIHARVPGAGGAESMQVQQGLQYSPLLSFQQIWGP